MQCIYCQNYQISNNGNESTADDMTVNEIVKQVEAVLRTGVKRVGLVSPSHFVPQMLDIIERIESDGYHPYYVYNTNCYDKADVIRFLSDKVDIYLPDFKYMDNRLAKDYSQTPNYAEYAQQAIKEMYRQKGAEIVLDEERLITSGLIIRHLILPHHIENSKAVLRFIAQELSPDIYISLMSQYYPPPQVAHHPQLGRTLTQSEYDEVIEEFYRLGFHRGFLQELHSSSHYQPDFSQQKPFEN